MQNESVSQHKTAARPRFATNAVPVILFWLSFAALNVLLHLPAYWFNRADSSFWPPAHDAAALLGQRSNLDPWRLSAELTLLAAAWLFWPRLRQSRWARPFRLLLSAGFILALLYAVYETLSLSFYAKEPVFYEQVPLAWQELPFLLRSLQPRAAQIAGSITVLLFAAWLVRSLLQRMSWPLAPGEVGLGSRMAAAVLLLIVVAGAARHGMALARPESAISCLGCKLAQNAQASAALAAEVRALTAQPLVEQLAPAAAGALLKQPDIYLIFIESYGSILYQKEALRAPYLALLAEVEAELAAGGWHSATALSDSPTWGGGSWLAYTSALFGLRLDSHSAYLTFRERFDAETHANLGRSLQELGYHYAHVTPIAAELPPAEQAGAEAFYGVDRWLTYTDLGYRGAHYGWGPAPPDQFALGRANAILTAESNAPLLLFMLTQNSHYPWQDVPPLAADYLELLDPLAEPVQTSLKMAQVTAEPADYMAAIAYELRFLSQFVRQQVDEDALIILIGDHQPGYISRRADGFASPIHVLSKDEGLTAVFQTYGFAPGLLAADLQPDLKHEGLASLLLRALLQHYGSGTGPLPPYTPLGQALGPEAPSGS